MWNLRNCTKGCVNNMADFDEIIAEIRKLERKLRHTTDPVMRNTINAEIENLYWELEG